ncbi:MAG TPA: hypothetical protein VKR22_00645 [Acidimicrobiales bacterium]|nr:hypothetical protein [Acidimicrobiales bacterium]
MDPSEVRALLEADASEPARNCIEAVDRGARTAPVRESHALDQHIHWLRKHSDSLAECNGHDVLTRLEEYLTDPSTRSIALTSIGLDDEAISDSWFTLAIDPARARLICCLEHRRQPPRRAERGDGSPQGSL